MQRLRGLVLLAFVPAILLVSGCGDSTAVETPASIVVVSPIPTHAVKPTPKPTPKRKPTPKPVVVANPYAAAKAAGATAVCADGSWSFSQNRSGTCSHHGGVHWWTGNLGAPGPGGH